MLLEASDGTILHPKNFLTQKTFNQAVQSSIDDYLVENTVPDFVVLPFDVAKAKRENKDIDKLSASIKRAFSAHGYNVKTMVISGNLYDYKSVDLIHVCKHLLTSEDEMVLQGNSKLKAKIMETLGVPSNINWKFIQGHLNQSRVILRFLGNTESAILSQNKKVYYFRWVVLLMTEL